MANINLNNYFRKSSDKISPVDSKIRLNKVTTDNEIWGDLKLDLQFDELKERALNAEVSNHDLQRVVNEQSVITALRNIFKTYKCSRLLNPQMSFDIASYLFEPLTTSKAWFIGYEIYMQLPKYQPRVKIDNVNVIADIRNDSYIIQLSISIPNISGKSFKVSSILSAQGYSIIR